MNGADAAGRKIADTILRAQSRETDCSERNEQQKKKDRQEGQPITHTWSSAGHALIIDEASAALCDWLEILNEAELGSASTRKRSRTLPGRTPRREGKTG